MPLNRGICSEPKYNFYSGCETQLPAGHFGFYNIRQRRFISRYSCTEVQLDKKHRYICETLFELRDVDGEAYVYGVQNGGGTSTVIDEDTWIAVKITIGSDYPQMR